MHSLHKRSASFSFDQNQFLLYVCIYNKRMLPTGCCTPNWIRNHMRRSLSQENAKSEISISPCPRPWSMPTQLKNDNFDSLCSSQTLHHQFRCAKRSATHSMEAKWVALYALLELQANDDGSGKSRKYPNNSVESHYSTVSWMFSLCKCPYLSAEMVMVMHMGYASERTVHGHSIDLSSECWKSHGSGKRGKRSAN